MPYRYGTQLAAGACTPDTGSRRAGAPETGSRRAGAPETGSRHLPARTPLESDLRDTQATTHSFPDSRCLNGRIH